MNMSPSVDDSGNKHKYQSKNPLQRFLIDRFYESMFALLSKADFQSVLDAGCGEGFSLLRLSEVFPDKHLHGLELRREAVDFCGVNLPPEIKVDLGSVYAMPYPEKSFDLVIASEVLEHLDDPTRCLTECGRVSRQYVLATVPNEPFFMAANFLRGKNLRGFGNDPEHIQHWSSGRFARLFGGHFEIIAQDTSFPWTLVLGKMA